MKHGDITRMPPAALAFHLDCVLEDPGKLGLIKRVARVGDPLAGKRLVVGAGEFSANLIHHSDYSLIVIVTEELAKKLDAVKLRNRLEDQWGFVASLVLCLPEIVHVQHYLADQNYVQIYYDPNEERLLDIGFDQIRTRLFQRWNMVGY